MFKRPSMSVLVAICVVCGSRKPKDIPIVGFPIGKSLRERGLDFASGLPMHVRDRA